MDFMAHTFRFMVAAVFLMAASAKGRSRTHALQASINAFGIVPQRLSGSVAVWLPRLEFTRALFLGVGFFIRWTATALAALLILFTLGLIRVLGGGGRVDCGCFGASSTTASWWTVARNLGLLVMTLLVVARRPEGLSIGFATAAFDAPGPETDMTGRDALAALMAAIMMTGAASVGSAAIRVARVHKVVRAAHSLLASPIQ